jgi:hypothetical protein
MFKCVRVKLEETIILVLFITKDNSSTPFKNFHILLFNLGSAPASPLRVLAFAPVI